MSSNSSQSTRTSPTSYGTARRTASVSSASPPQHPSNQAASATAQNAMLTVDVYSPTSSSSQPQSLGSSFSYPFPSLGHSAASFDGAPGGSLSQSAMFLGDPDLSSPIHSFPPPSIVANGNGAGGVILMRKLPRNTSREALRSMLLFAKDLVDADFVPTEMPEDSGFLTAIARFDTLAAADEARALLDGKPNSKNDANMVVEVLSALHPPRRNTIDSSARSLLGNPTATTTTSTTTGGPVSRQSSSRFNDTFQSLERLVVPSVQPNGDAALPTSTESGSSRLHSLFSPQSPIGNGAGDLPRVSGKSVIDQDPDEDTGELLKDPVGYAENGHSTSISAATGAPPPRRSTNPQVPPTGRFGSLSLASNVPSSSLPQQGYAGNGASGRMVPPAPTAPMYPQTVAVNGNNVTHPFHYANQHTPRHSLPAANPNDLNPPCNTLYVGNLPPDTSEEELKALFSKQRGYKRLCFRNKQNGPMCFVEFDEVAMASKALNDLYGYKLSNSVKTGIRLSFSKNPLGVRSGQPGSSSANPLAASQGAIPGANAFGGLPHPVFSAVSGPPPGLSVPPGLTMPMALRNGGLHPNAHMPAMANGTTFNPNNGLGMRTNGMNSMIMPGPQIAGGMGGSPAPPNVGVFGAYYPDYMMGR